MPSDKREMDHYQLNYGDDFIEPYEQSDDAETTCPKLSESQLKELEDDGNFTNYDDEEEEEEDENDDDDDDKENSAPIKTGLVSHSNQMMPNMAVNKMSNNQPHFSLSFSNDKLLSDDLLVRSQWPSGSGSSFSLFNKSINPC